VIQKLLVVGSLFVAVNALLLQSDVFAAKKRVPRVSGGKVVRGTNYSSARLSRATNSVVVTFLNLNRVRRVTYELGYSTRGIPQGVVGTITPSGQASDSRDLYFGTCSHGVCTPHYDIANAVLIVSTQLSSDKTNVKRYRIRV
jgi:hypothetical protein